MQSPPRASERLDSWKEIAAYLKKGERTVRRWEQTERLPVHRHLHDGRSTVYAYPAELDEWLAERTPSPAVNTGQSDGSATLPEPKKGRISIAVLTAGLVVLGLVAVMARTRGASGSEVYEARPLTAFLGEEAYPSFFPDGKRVAFAWVQPNGESDVYVKALSSEAVQRLTQTPEREISPAVSPDGRFIAFLRLKEAVSAVILRDLSNGRERQLTQVSTPHPSFYGAPGPFLAWLPDAIRLLVVTKDGNNGPAALVLHHIENGSAITLTKPLKGPWGDSEPAVSPDGTMLAFSRTVDVGKSDLFIMDLRTKPFSERLLLSDKRWNRSPAWTPEGRAIVFTSGFWGRVKLMRIDATGRRPATPILGVGEGGYHPVISREGTLVYTHYQQVNEIWRQPLDDSGRGSGAAVITVASTRSELHPQISPDGKWLAYHSDRSGSQEIWVARPDGSEPRRITNFDGPPAGSARWSPDSRRLTFDALIDGQHEIFTSDRDGGNLTRLTHHGSADILPRWSRDGGTILFASQRSGEFQIWRVSADGGEPARVTTGGGVVAEESVDGKHLYFLRSDGDSNTLLRIPAGGGEEVRVLERVFGRRFTVTKRGVYYQPADVSEPVFLFHEFGRPSPIRVASAKSFIVNPISVSTDALNLYFAADGPARVDLMAVPRFNP